MFDNITFYFVFFLLGYLTGRFNGLIRGLRESEVYYGNNSRVDERESSKKKNSKKIEIDDRKFVTDVETNTYEKSFTGLGQTQTIQDNIDSSVSKLASLKRK